MIRPRHNAGYDILLVSEAYETESTGATCHIVLGLSAQGHYVTWDALCYPHGSWAFFWGHYTTKREEAYFDFHKRLLEKVQAQWGGKTKAAIQVNVAPHNYTPASLMHHYAKAHPGKARAVNLPHGGTALHLYELGRSYVYDHWDIADGGEDGHTVTLHHIER